MARPLLPDAGLDAAPWRRRCVAKQTHAHGRMAGVTGNLAMRIDLLGCEHPPKS